MDHRRRPAAASSPVSKCSNDAMARTKLQDEVPLNLAATEGRLV